MPAAPAVLRVRISREKNVKKAKQRGRTKTLRESKLSKFNIMSQTHVIFKSGHGELTSRENKMPYFDPHSSTDWNEANQLLLSNLNKLSHTLFPSENPAVGYCRRRN